MAIKFAPPINQVTKGAISCNFIHLGGNVWIIHRASTPTDGTAGDGAGFAGKGSIFIDTNAGELYTNTNTKASPTWTNQT